MKKQIIASGLHEDPVRLGEVEMSFTPLVAGKKVAKRVSQKSPVGGKG